MEYARSHVKRYWGFAYRRALGISLITFAIAMATGVAFSSMLGAGGNTGFTSTIIFWGFLILITAAVLVANFVKAHTSCVKFLTNEEHRHHSRHMGIWMAALILGALAFLAPMLYFGSAVEPLVLLFSFGGVFWVLYLSVLMLFRHSYNEIAVGAIALWAVFFIGVMNISGTSAAVNPAYVLFISTIALIIVCGFTGIMMVSISSNEFLSEFENSASKRGSTRRKRR
ncbi:MAG: hypothetical protein KGH66_00485 [Candidatus Micrarchaeota archaeon]|nr:hypothetical protein [Candidatus Micrarchaeota archaeon]